MTFQLWVKYPFNLTNKYVIIILDAILSFKPASKSAVRDVRESQNQKTRGTLRREESLSQPVALWAPTFQIRGEKRQYCLYIQTSRHVNRVSPHLYLNNTHMCDSGLLCVAGFAGAIPSCKIQSDKCQLRLLKSATKNINHLFRTRNCNKNISTVRSHRVFIGIVMIFCSINKSSVH